MQKAEAPEELRRNSAGAESIQKAEKQQKEAAVQHDKAMQVMNSLKFDYNILKEQHE